MMKVDPLKEIKKDIAASLYLKPASLEELLEREFLHNRSEWGISVLIDQMIKDEWIYERNDKYHTYKKFAESEEMNDYELHGLR